MRKFYQEIVAAFPGLLKDDVIDAAEAACVCESEWREDRADCIQRIRGAMEELHSFDSGNCDHVDEAQEWYDFDPDC